MSDELFGIRDGENGSEYLQRILSYWADALAQDTHTDLANEVMRLAADVRRIEAEHDRRYNNEFGPRPIAQEKLTHKGGKGYYNDDL